MLPNSTTKQDFEHFLSKHIDTLRKIYAKVFINLRMTYFPESFIKERNYKENITICFIIPFLNKCIQEIMMNKGK